MHKISGIKLHSKFYFELLELQVKHILRNLCIRLNLCNNENTNILPLKN